MQRLLMFLLGAVGCTLSFEKDKDPPPPSAELAALEFDYCDAASSRGPYQGILDALQKKWQTEDCRRTLTRLAGSDFLDLSGLFPSAANLWDETTIIAKFPGIIHLKLSSNNLHDISLLAHLPQIKYLYLDHNEVQTLEPLRNLNLVWLDVSFNNISSIEPILGMPSLSDLYIESNPLASSPRKDAWPQLSVLRY